MHFKLVIVALMALMLFGCGEESDIAENHVAVLSVTRWDDYKDQLQPQFSLTADQAYAAGLQDTLQLQQSLAGATAAAFSLQLAPSGAFPGGFGMGQSGAATTQPATPSTQPSATTQPYPLVGSAPLGVDQFLQYQAGTALYQEVKLLNRYVTDAAIPQGYRAYVVRVQLSTMPKKRGLHFDEFVDLGLFFDKFEQPTVDTEPVKIASLQTHDQAKTAAKESERIFNEATDAFNKSHPAVEYPATTQSSEEQEKKNAQLQEQKQRLDAMRSNVQAVRALAKRLDTVNTTVASWTTPPALKTRSEILCELESITDDADNLNSAYAAQIVAATQQLSKAIRQLPSLHTDTPKIIPLLVTDEIESALAARQADNLQQLAFSLSAAYAGIGGNVSLTNLEAAMRSAVGRDYNSLLSIARINDNTVRVRIGARQTGQMPTDPAKAAELAESYELLTQTHYISFLVLVPSGDVMCQPQSVYFGTHTTFVNLENNQSIASKQPTRKQVEDALYAQFGDEYRDLSSSEQNPPESHASVECALYDAASAAENSDYEKFADTIDCNGAKDVGRVNRLWLEMTEDRIDSAFDGGSFEVPKYPDPSLFNNADSVVALDDGTQTTITVPGYLKTSDPRVVSVEWTFTSETDQPQGAPVEKGTPITLSALAIQFKNGNLYAIFPSLKNLKKPPKAQGGALTIAVNGLPVTNSGTGVVYLSTTATLNTPNGTAFTLSVDPPIIAQTQRSGQGSVQLTLVYTPEYQKFLAGATIGANPAKFPLLSLSGVAIFGPNLPAQLVQDSLKNPANYRINSNGNISLSIPLSGLVADQPVTFTVTAPDGWASPAPLSRIVAPFKE